ncbi:MAG: Ig-like domain-containing protein [Eubacterium sp.]|nr:Ig-like domain-containing protein [Eubacterium sp.]
MKRKLLLTLPILIIGILLYGNPSKDHVNAATVTVTTKEQLKNAITAEGDADIKLGADIKGLYDVTIPQGKNVTLDLNGHTLDAGLYSGVNTPANKKPLFWVYGNLEINDLSNEGKITGASYSALVIYPSGMVTMNGGIFTKNWSNLSGGAISVLGGSFIMNDGELFNNSTSYQVASKGMGGAIYMTNYNDNECEVTINGGAISWNFASYGGGIYVSNGKLNINGGAIGSTTGYNHMGNQTPKAERGSGIYINKGILDMTGGEIRGQDKSGVVVGEKGTFNFRGGKVNGNLTGIYNYGTMNMTGGEILGGDLYGAQQEGVIVDYGATFWMKAGTIHNNHVGVVVQGTASNEEERPSLFHMTGGEIRDNKGNEKGAGVKVAEGGAMVMSGGTISGNTTGNYSLHDYYGGGVCVIDQYSQFAMTGGTITGNSCPEGDGGGIYVGKGATCILTGGTITQNSASDTGGQHYGGGVFVAYDGICQISGKPVITDNYLLDNNNTVSNLHVNQTNYGAERVLTVNAPLMTGAKIGVTVKNNYMPLTVTEDYNSNMDDVAGLYFFSDNPKYHVTRNSDGEVILKDCNSTLNKIAASAATCTETGNIEYYQCPVCKELFTDAAGTIYTTKTLVTTNAIGHDWGEPTYTWSDDHKSIIAKRVCKNDASHVETEDGEIFVSVALSGSCQVLNMTCYTAEFANPAFEDQRYIETTTPGPHKPGNQVVENIVASTCTEEGSCDFVYYCKYCNEEMSRVHKTYSALGHDFTEWEQVQSTRFRYCKRCGYYETESVTWDTCTHEKELIPEEAATCVTYGMKAHYKCKYCGAVFEKEDETTPVTKDEMDKLVINKDQDNGHKWSDKLRENERAADCLTADSYDIVRYCERCGKREEEDTYTGNPLGHRYGEPVYTWSEDNLEVTATHICNRDSAHVETETVETTSQITPATCTAKGKITYTAVFNTQGFTNQTKTVDGDDIKDHDWDDAEYTWSEDNSEVTATHTCKACQKDESETVTTISRVTKAVTCTQDGVTTYTALFTNPTFESQTKQIANINKTGHDWGEPEYNWSSDNKVCEAVRTCKNDPDEIESEIVDTSEVTKQATCCEKGETTYTAVFTKACFDEQTKVVELPIDSNKHVPRAAVKENDVKATCTLCGSFDEVIYCDICNKELERTTKKTDALGHKWGEWKITKEATVAEEGIEERTCTVCGEKESRSLEKLAPVSDEEIDKQIIEHKDESDLKGSSFTLLMAKGVPVSKNSIKLTWKKVPGAKEYIIYGNKCGRKNKYKRITSVKSKKYIRKNLKVGTYYKHIIVAVDEYGQILAISKTIHCVTNGGKNGNNTKVIPSKRKLTLKVGKSKKIKAKLKAKKPVHIHRDIAWESDNPSIATVNKKGKIKGISKGTCYVYAYAQNGVYARIKVTVKK